MLEIEHSDDKKIELTRRSFIKTPILATAGAVATSSGMQLAKPGLAFAAAKTTFHSFSSLPGLSAQYVASTISQPSQLIAGGSYTKEVVELDDFQGVKNVTFTKYIIQPGKTANFRLVNCGTDADGKRFDVWIQIGPVKAISPSNGSQWLHFFLRYPRDFEGHFGWEIDSNCAEAWVRIRYYKTGTNNPANVKIFGCFSDIDQSQGTRNNIGTKDGFKGGNEGVSFGQEQAVKVYTKPGHWMELDAAKAGAFFTDGTRDGTGGDFDDCTTIWITKDAWWLDVYYTGGNCGIDFSFRLPGGVVKYYSDGLACFSEVWAAGKWHTVPSSATIAGDKTYCTGPFDGWYVNSNYTGKYNGSTLKEGTINLYGRNYAKIRYYVDGSSTNVYSRNIQYGSWHSVDADATTAARKAGCSPGFDGWYTDRGFSNRYNGETIKEDKALYARNMLTVHYRVDGSSKDVYHQSVPYGSTYYIPGEATNVAKKSGCTPGFTGWHTDPACTKKYVAGTKLTKDIILYAKNMLTVHYHVDGSDADVHSQKAMYGSSYAVDPEATRKATKPNCTPGFIGWHVDKDCKTKYVRKVVTGDMHLYSRNMLTVKFEYSSKTEHKDRTPYYARPGDVATNRVSIALPADKVVMATSQLALTYPRKEMFESLPDRHWLTLRFNAWSLNENMSGALINKVTPVHDTIIYAKWVEAPVDGVEDARLF